MGSSEKENCETNLVNKTQNSITLDFQYWFEIQSDTKYVKVTKNYFGLKSSSRTARSCMHKCCAIQFYSSSPKDFFWPIIRSRQNFSKPLWPSRLAFERCLISWRLVQNQGNCSKRSRLDLRCNQSLWSPRSRRCRISIRS